MVGHALKHWPWHDLKKIPLDGRRNAVHRRGNRRRRCTGWMEMVEIFASPHDHFKIRKRVAAFRPPGLVRRQVARNNVRTDIIPIDGAWAGDRTEVHTSN